MLAEPEELEIVEQCCHRGVEPVAVAELECEALLQAAREHPRRIEMLQAVKHPLDAREVALQRARDTVEVAGQPARIVEPVDDLRGDDPIDGVGNVDLDLREEMVAQAYGPRETLIRIEVGIVE